VRQDLNIFNYKQTQQHAASRQTTPHTTPHHNIYAEPRQATPRHATPRQLGVNPSWAFGFYVYLFNSNII
jgi:hypothetical protein